MADVATIRSTIHSLWESFFPSTIYFILYAVVAIVLSNSIDALSGVHFDQSLVARLKQYQFYSDLKELELHKAIPFAGFAVFALLVYLFDRSIVFFSNFIPPFPEWHGSAALFADRHRLRTLWILLPQVENPAALDFEAQSVIDRAQIEGKSLPSNSKEYFEKKFSRAATTLNYGKTGLLWSLFVFMYVLIFSSPNVSIFIWFIIFVGMFFAIGVWGIVQETKYLIAQMNENLRIAEAILRAEGNRVDDNSESNNRSKLFDERLKTSLSFSKRFVQLRWRPRKEWSPLLKAFIGNHSASK